MDRIRVKVWHFSEPSAPAECSLVVVVVLFCHQLLPFITAETCLHLFIFFFPFINESERTEKTGVVLVLVPLHTYTHTLTHTLILRLWLCCDYYTFSGGFNHGPVGPSPQGGPHFNVYVCYFPPQFIALSFILPGSPTDIRGLLE